MAFGKKKKKQEDLEELEAMAAEGEEDGEDGGKPKRKLSGKLKILIGVAVLLIVGTAVLGFLVLKKQGGKVKEEPEEYKPPEYDEYVVRDDHIASLTKVNGYRPLADASGIGIEFIPPEYDEEGNIIPPKKKKSNKTMDQTLEGIEEEPQVRYVYKDIETIPADVKAYVEYLKSNYSFTDVFPFYIDNPAGYISLTKDSDRAGFNLVLDIDYTKTEAVITMEEVKKPKEAKKKGQQAAPTTIGRLSAIDVLKAIEPTKLGLEGDWNQYSLVGEDGHILIDNQDCYGIRVYQEMPDHTTRIKGIYYMAADRTTIYHYDSMTNEYTRIQ